VIKLDNGQTSETVEDCTAEFLKAVSI